MHAPMYAPVGPAVRLRPVHLDKWRQDIMPRPRRGTVHMRRRGVHKQRAPCVDTRRVYVRMHWRMSRGRGSCRRTAGAARVRVVCRGCGRLCRRVE